MFDRNIYVQRRTVLKETLKSGIVLFLGNEESPMNYRDNTYSFRQDGSFLYYWGLDFPALAAIIDIDENKEIVFGDDPTVEEIVWTGPQPTLRGKAEKVGVANAMPSRTLEDILRKAVKEGRTVHFLPQYRPEQTLKIHALLGISPLRISEYVSKPFTKAVVAQRSVKSSDEIREIEKALGITYEMQTTAMKASKPGTVEREIAGLMEGIAVSRGGNLAFPIIFSIHGETLHNHSYGNVMKAGNIVVNDSGAESSLHYAGDITRTFPVSGKFTDQQKEIYRIVFNAQEQAIQAVTPGVKFREVHLLACRALASGLKDLGLMKGNTDEAVQSGAHALFFQCGLGHFMGLDVHDMEGLGEDYVGYDNETTRNPQFGICYLRLAKALQPGYVITVEPGIYMIPELMDAWKAGKKFEQFINYDRVEQFRSFGGIRLEDNVQVTEKGHLVLGKPIPRTLEEVEATCTR